MNFDKKQASLGQYLQIFSHFIAIGIIRTLKCNELRSQWSYQVEFILVLFFSLLSF